MKKKPYQMRNRAGKGGNYRRCLGNLVRRWRHQAAELAALSTETARKLEENTQVYQSLFDYNPDAVYQLDLSGNFLSANQSGQKLAGYSLEEALRISFLPLIAPEDIERTLQHFMLACQGSVQTYEIGFRQRNGTYRDIQVINTPIIVGGEIVGVYGIAKDITVHRQAEADRQRAEADLQASERRFRALAANASDVIAIIDENLNILYASPSAAAVWGYAPEKLTGLDWSAIIHPLDITRLRHSIMQAEASSEEVLTLELRLRYGDAGWHTHEVIISNQRSEPAVGGFVLTCRDITERKAFEERLRHQAFYDSLTGLPNRALFMDRLTQILDTRQKATKHATVIFIDLDNFKVVNDSLGHTAGDKLLLAVSKRMLGCIRNGDTLARLGGDEFTVLLPETEDSAEAAEIVVRLSQSLQGAFSLDQRDVFVTASFGVALSKDTGPSPEDLVRAADTAMYEAKAGGKAGYELYKCSMTAQALERLELEGELRQALEYGQLRLHYQPIIRLDTGITCEVEALVRWEHPRRGLIPPDKFIPLAEQTGLIIPLGQWVLKEACRQGHEWHTMFPAEAPLIVGVNISTRQFQDAALVSTVSDVLAQTGFPAASLKLEITESLLILNTIAISKLHTLKDLGVSIAVDDFGTGYSSMAYLANFPLDTLKIDQSFVRQITETERSAAIVQAIITLAKAHNLQVTSEGIETNGQRLLLEGLGCDFGQGYLFSRPLSASAMTRWLESQSCLQSISSQTTKLAA